MAAMAVDHDEVATRCVRAVNTALVAFVLLLIAGRVTGVGVSGWSSQAVVLAAALLVCVPLLARPVRAG